jgi:protein-tyrosine kinase
MSQPFIEPLQQPLPPGVRRLVAETGAALPIEDAPRPLSQRELEERRLIHRHDTVRPQANAFRELRTRLLDLAGNRRFTTMVAPVSQRCGGSFVARNLAAAFAFDDAKTAFLIDCDARDPSQHDVLGVNARGGGLMDYLDDCTVSVAGLAHATGIPRLSLIPAGRRREIAGESLGSTRMRALVELLRDTDDERYLILDSPPVLGSPDARILSQLVDFVVLVAGYGRTTPASIEKAADTFAPEKLAGVVFNHDC